MKQRDLYCSSEQMMRSVMKASQSKIWTTLPALIESFDDEAMTVTAQPAIKEDLRQRDGSIQAVDLPLLVDVPVIFPQGGGCVLTFPLTVGDECLIVFASRCIDAWWQSGGIQRQAEYRMHDLSDGFCLPGPFSQNKKPLSTSLKAVQLRSYDGQAYIALDPKNHEVNVNTIGNVSITSPNITLNGNVTINGNLAQGISAGHGAVLNGPLNVQNDVVAAGISLSGHVHGGVQSGESQTGGAQ